VAARRAREDSFIMLGIVALTFLRFRRTENEARLEQGEGRHQREGVKDPYL
jgi:hypothetical protein